MGLSKWSKAVAVAAAFALLTIGVVGALSYFSPWLTLERAQRALIAHDKATLDVLIDWGSARDKMIVPLAQKALKAAGVGPSDERAPSVILSVEKAVDEMITADNLTKILEQAQGGTEKHLIRGGYLRMGVFVFAIENQTTKGIIGLRLRRLGPFSWIIDEVFIIDPSREGG